MITTTTTSPPSRTRVLKRLIAGVLLLNLLVGGIVCFSLRNSNTLYERGAAITAQNISRVLDEDIAGIVAKVDIALQSVGDEAERQLAHGVIQEEALDSFIVRQHSRLPELISFRATDAAGDAHYGSQTKVARTTSLAHRDYFKLLRDTPNAGMVISKPVIGGISGKWLVASSVTLSVPARQRRCSRQPAAWTA